MCEFPSPHFLAPQAQFFSVFNRKVAQAASAPGIFFRAAPASRGQIKRAPAPPPAGENFLATTFIKVNVLYIFYIIIIIDQIQKKRL